jgi:hypothetical protein
VTGDGRNVTGQAGTHLLGGIADELGIASGWSAVMADTTTRSTAHDRGRLLTHVAMMIAAGGRCLSDLRTLRNQPLLFGDVASDATAWRAMQQVDDERLAGLVQVRQSAIRRLLEQVPDEEVVLDIDASLVNVDSDAKQGAASNFKGGFGFHPMLCFIEPAGLAVGMCGPATRPRTTSATSCRWLTRPSLRCRRCGRQAIGPVTTLTGSVGCCGCVRTPRQAGPRCWPGWPPATSCSSSGCV